MFVLCHACAKLQTGSICDSCVTNRDTIKRLETRDDYITEAANEILDLDGHEQSTIEAMQQMASDLREAKFIIEGYRNVQSNGQH